MSRPPEDLQLWTPRLNVISFILMIPEKISASSIFS